MNDDDINTARVEGSAFAGGRLPISLVVEHIDREKNGIKMIFTPEKHNVS